MNHNFETLKLCILEASIATEWDDARPEWVVDGIFRVENPASCICSRYPIKECCELLNTLNSKRLIVGNVCVNHFWGFNLNRLFASIRKVETDLGLSLSEDMIRFAKQRNWIDKWQYEFYQDTRRKRALSHKQLMIRAKINYHILKKVHRTYAQPVYTWSSSPSDSNA
jgi:hypothetical protein